MENLTKVVNCSNCSTPFRIPSNKHIKAICPNCKSEFEYINGEKVSKSKKKNWLIILLLFAVIAATFWIITGNSNHENQNDARLPQVT